MSIYKGGYLTIDCGGGDIATESGIEIPGVYNAVKETEGKVVILKSVTIGASTFDYFVLQNLSHDGTSYGYQTADIIILIGNTDVIIAEAVE